MKLGDGALVALRRFGRQLITDPAERILDTREAAKCVICGTKRSSELRAAEKEADAPHCGWPRPLVKIRLSW